MSCSRVDSLPFTTMRFLLSEICHSAVGTKLSLQPETSLSTGLPTKRMVPNLTLWGKSFWVRDRQSAFIDIWVFNPYAPYYRNFSLAQFCQKNELEKTRAYQERVQEIEHGSFSPLVFSVAGGIGDIATIVYKRLAS